MKKSNLGTLALLAILITSCSKERLMGEGQIITDNRTIIATSGLETVKVNGSSSLHIIYGRDYKLEVKGYGNLVTALSTELKNNILTVEFPNHYNVRNDNTEVFLTMPNLPNLYLNGSINAYTSGDFPDQSDLFFKISGSATLNAGFIKVKRLNVNISGSADLNVVNVITKSADISISGSGKIKATVSDNLKASISGSGEILYIGNPVVDSKISGSGKITRI